MPVTKHGLGKTGASEADGSAARGGRVAWGLAGGKYVGNGMDRRVVSIGVDLASFDNAVVHILDDASVSRYGVEEGLDGLGGAFLPMEWVAGVITELTSGGFVLGMDESTNGGGLKFHWVAYWSDNR